MSTPIHFSQNKGGTRGTSATKQAKHATPRHGSVDRVTANGSSNSPGTIALFCPYFNCLQSDTSKRSRYPGHGRTSQMVGGNPLEHFASLRKSRLCTWCQAVGFSGAHAQRCVPSQDRGEQVVGTQGVSDASCRTDRSYGSRAERPQVRANDATPGVGNGERRMLTRRPARLLTKEPAGQSQVGAVASRRSCK